MFNFGLQKPSHNRTKIGLKTLQTNALNILFSLSFTLFLTTLSNAQVSDRQQATPIAIPLHTIAIDTMLKSEKLITEQSLDTTKNDSITKEKEFLTSKVDYKAKEYMRLSKKENKMYLYDEAEIIYGDLQINAGYIIVDSEKNEVYAYGIKDTTDAYVQTPIFKQGESVVEPDSIRFNFKTKKALIYNSKTEQNGFNIYNEVSKRENDSVIYMQHVRFTTSENIEDPEYYFYARKIKYVPKKKIVTGLVNMYIADVPTPLGLPFAFFPMTEERTSGFILPSFGDDNTRGFFLQNGGYYFALSDYLDLTLQGDYFTNASYAIRSSIDYAKRYRFRGNLDLSFENILNSERGFPDFTKTSIYNIRWSHSKDSKSNPNSRFSASVNLGSSNFFQDSRSQTNTANFLNNTLSSSINFSKTFPGEPQVNVDVAATHSQNTGTQEINMTLPTVNAAVSRIFPFAPKTGSKKGIIENINLQYTFRGENSYSTTDSLFFRKEMFENAELGMSHDIPVSTNFKLFKHLSASMSASFAERWVFETIEQRYDPEAINADERTGIARDTIKGFDAYRTYGFNTSVGTTIYGTFNFGKDKKIQTIRHVMRPSVGYNITPAFDQFYDEFVLPVNEALGRTEEELVEYSRFEGGAFSAPSNNFSSSVSLSLNNTLEAKVRDRDSTAVEPKKIKIINNLNMSTSYDIARDSIKMSPVNINGGIPIVAGKLDINFRMTLNPYALNSTNQVFDTWNINNGGSLFRLTSASTNFGYALSNKDFNKKEKDKNKEGKNKDSFKKGGRPDDLFGVNASGTNGSLFGDDDDKEDKSGNEYKNYRFKIPWSLRLQYNINYNNSARQNEISSHSMNFSGDIEFSPKWKIGASSGYDFKNFGFTFTQLRFERDLESWRMSFSWTPFGPRTSWNFFIGIKSSVLSDIKWEKIRAPDRSF